MSGLDWHPTTNKIVSCAHDRNAFVWCLDAAGKVWVPQVVILRVNRAAMGVRWAPDGRKFAVASSNKQVMVCYYEDASNWWVSRALKKAKSAITAVAWHPCGRVVASASTDYRCRVACAALPEVDGKTPAPASAAVFGELLPLGGDNICEFEETRVSGRERGRAQSKR